MYRKFRRFRVAVIVYACGSLCGILLLINFNEEVKRLLQQQPRYTSGPHEHDHDQEHNPLVESALVSSRDVLLSGDDGGITGGVDITGAGNRGNSDENSQQSKARQELNLVASGSLTQSPRESMAKPWFMWRGTRFPTVATSRGRLWHEEDPDSDRIIEQLMYLTQDDINQLPSPSYTPTIYGLGLGAIFGSDSSQKAVSESQKPRIPSETNSSSNNGQLQLKTSSTNRSVIIRSPTSGTSSLTSTTSRKSNPIKTILLYYGLGMSWGSHITSGRHVFMQQKCPVNACRLTGNRSQLSKADVVVFKDVFMNPKVRRSLDQLWVIYMLECPLNTQNFMDKNVFNMTATYRHDSDIVTPYEKWVYYDDRVRALPQGMIYTHVLFHVRLKTLYHFSFITFLALLKLHMVRGLVRFPLITDKPLPRRLIEKVCYAESQKVRTSSLFFLIISTI